MATVYSSLPLSNDLQGQTTEFDFLFKFFKRKDIIKKADFDYTRKMNVAELTSILAANQKKINVFHFSGHSGKNGLDFTDAEFNTDHFIKFFNTISSNESSLQCVFLNGCENDAIVNKLSKVPVVIGTHSKILDSTAAKFTQDFFSSLIQSGNTYVEAFEAAKNASNLPETKVTYLTRGEGGDLDISAQAPLNDYFISINNSKIANHTFPFKPAKIKWTRYIFLLLLVVVLGLGFLFRENISFLTKEYNCGRLNFKNDLTCNFLVGQIGTKNDIRPIESWLAPILSTKFQDQMEGVFLRKEAYYDEFIHNKKFSPDYLPQKCNYDFNVDADFFDSLKQVRIVPYEPGTLLDSTFTYGVKSMQRTETINTNITEENIKGILLFEICRRCALKKNLKELPDMAIKMKEITNHPGTLDYQRIYKAYAEFKAENKDTTAAIAALDVVARSVGNDFALMAVESKISLYETGNKIKDIFTTQSDLIGEYQLRLDHPSNYEIRGELKDYMIGQNNIKLDRARLIFQHKDDILKDYAPIALQDFIYLQSIHFPPGDFSKEIELLQEAKKDDSPKLHLHGNIYDSSGKPVSGAKVQYGGTRNETDANGHFDLGSYKLSDILDQPLSIAAKNYQAAIIQITESNFQSITLQPIPSPTRVSLQAWYIDPGQLDKIAGYLKNAGYTLGGINPNMEKESKDIVKTPTVLYFSDQAQTKANLLANQLYTWTGEKYEIAKAAPTFKSSAKTSINDLLILQIVGMQKKITLQGFVFTNGKPLSGVSVVFKEYLQKTDNKGFFYFNEFPEIEVIGQPIFFKRENFQDLTLIINQDNLQKVEMKQIKIPNNELKINSTHFKGN